LILNSLRLGRARDLCRELNATRESEDDRRRHILRDLFGKGGDSVWMQPPFYCDYGSNIELGGRWAIGLPAHPSSASLARRHRSK
jgi:acetyltransferase-like isoleucine patch superfamily enzyme